MPTDAGGSFICLISCVLFISIAAGGGCLLMYMILPEPQTRSWLPITGVTLVCLPWLFWLLTFIFRLISRSSGFKFGIGNADAVAGGGVEVINTAAAASNLCASTDLAAPSDQSPGGDTGSSNINVSQHSHESEMPLALSMAS